MSSIVPPRGAATAGILSVEKAAPGMPTVSVGDLLEATVLKNLGSDQLLIRLNGSETIRAESAVPLRAGETVSVRVDETRPLLILSVMESAMQESERVSEFLRFQRSNPGALLSMISNLPGALENKALAPFLSFLSKDHIQAVLKLLEGLHLPAKTSEGPLFFKAYLDNLGLLLESSLKKALKDGTTDAGRAGLKGALLRLSEELRALAGQKDVLAGDAVRKLDALEKLTAGSIKAIESEQVLNVRSQESESRYFFQVPLLLSSGPGMADICIEYQEGGRQREGQGGFRVLFLLNLDALGDVSVETKIQGRQLDCRIQCTDPDACGFIASHLKRLEDGLTGLGFQVGSIGCQFQENLSETRETFTRARMGGGEEALDVYI